MNKYRGISLTEVMVALVFIGVIAAATIPNLLFSMQNRQALLKTKSVSEQLLAARAQVLAIDENALPDGTALAQRTRYVGQAPEHAQPLSNDLLDKCDPTVYTCFYYPDGGVLQYRSSSAPPVYEYNYDPDQTGPLPTVVLKLDYATGRLAPRHAFDGAGKADPAYVRQWTKAS